MLTAPALFVLLAVAATWPLTLQIGKRVPGWYVADNYEYLWKMWWFKHSLLDRGQSPLFAPEISYPGGFHLAHAELTPLHTLVGLPLTAALGEIASYNLFAMLSFALSGWATYLLMLRLSGSRGAALLSGVLFALTPYHTVRYGGILPLMAVQGLPVTLLGLEMWAKDRSRRALAVFGLGYLLAAWASIYYAFGILLLGSLYLLVRMGSLRAAFGDRESLRGLILLGLTTSAILLPLAAPYLSLRQEVRLTIPLEETDFWSASPTDYLLPPGLHPLWGQFVQQRLLGVPKDYPQIALEFVLGVGWVAMLFAIYGWRRSAAPAKRAVLALTLVALMLSLGPRLHLGRHPVLIPVPESLLSSFHALMRSVGEALPTGETYQQLEEHGLPIPMPALLLRWLVPPLAGLRAWNRFAAFVTLGVALLAGLGYAAWERLELGPYPKRRARAAAVALAIAAFELWPGSIPLQPVQARAVDRWLADQPGNFTIMELPLASSLSARQLYYTRTHGKRIAFAYGTYYPYWYRDQFPELQQCPDPRCLELLSSWGVQFVLLNTEALPDGPTLRPTLDASASLYELTELEGIVVYRLDRSAGGCSAGCLKDH